MIIVGSSDNKQTKMLLEEDSEKSSLNERPVTFFNPNHLKRDSSRNDANMGPMKVHRRSNSTKVTEILQSLGDRNFQSSHRRTGTSTTDLPFTTMN